MKDLCDFQLYVEKKNLHQQYDMKSIQSYNKEIQKMILLYWEAKFINFTLCNLNDVLNKIQEEQNLHNVHKCQITLQIIDESKKRFLQPYIIWIDLQDETWYHDLIDYLEVEKITTKFGHDISKMTRHDLCKYKIFTCHKIKKLNNIPIHYQENHIKYLDKFYANLINSLFENTEKLISGANKKDIKNWFRYGAFDRKVMSIINNILVDENTYQGMIKHGKYNFEALYKLCFKHSKSGDVCLNNLKLYFSNITVQKIKLIILAFKNKYDNHVSRVHSINIHNNEEKNMLYDEKMIFWKHIFDVMKKEELKMNIIDLINGKYKYYEKKDFNNFLMFIKEQNHSEYERIECMMSDKKIEHQCMDYAHDDYIYAKTQYPHYYNGIMNIKHNEKDQFKSFLGSNVFLNSNPHNRNLPEKFKCFMGNKNYSNVLSGIRNIDLNKKKVYVLMPHKNYNQKTFNNNNIIQINRKHTSSPNLNIKNENNTVIFNTLDGRKYHINPINNRWHYEENNNIKEKKDPMSELVDLNGIHYLF